MYKCLIYFRIICRDKNIIVCVFGNLWQFLVVEFNGDLYSCEHYVYPENKLGNIWGNELITMVQSGKQKLFGINKKLKLTKSCRDCKYLFIMAIVLNIDLIHLRKGNMD